ncbi:hypothetical protein IJI70_01780 [Candidatus Saccharibacteria bacterium]|nr:hypothetical protein [Candidatus Saccharibacteria bacterium]
MDNNEDIILPKKSSKLAAPVEEKPPVEPEDSKKPFLIALIFAGAFIIVLVVALIILLTRPANDSTVAENDGTGEDTAEVAEVETVYVTPEGVEDAEADYQRHLEEEKAAAKTDEEVFDAEIRIINNKISNAEYDEALSRLDAISRDGLSVSQLFRLYNVYTRVFEGTGDTARYDEYVALRTEQRNLLVSEEE